MNLPPKEHHFRTAVARDIETLVSLCRELYEYDQTPFHETRHRKSIAELVQHPEWGRMELIEVNGEAAGYLVLTFGYSLEFYGRDALLDELYLRSAFRGRGLGKEAMEHVVATIQSLGIRALHLEVERTNTHAQEFYRRLGFEDHNRYLMTKWV